MLITLRSSSQKENYKKVLNIMGAWYPASFPCNFSVPSKVYSFCLFLGPNVFFVSTGRQGAVCQQPWREAQDQTAPLPAATAWQWSECERESFLQRSSLLSVLYFFFYYLSLCCVNTAQPASGVTVYMQDEQGFINRGIVFQLQSFSLRYAAGMSAPAPRKRRSVCRYFLVRFCLLRVGC